MSASAFPPYLEADDGERCYVRHDLAADVDAAIAYVGKLGLVDVEALGDRPDASLVAMRPHDCAQAGCNGELLDAGECGRRQEGWHDEVPMSDLEVPEGARLYWRIDWA